MADEFRSQPAGFVQRFLKRENAHHQVQELCHSRDSGTVPGPDLRADVVDELPRKPVSMKVFSQPEIESRIIDKDHGVRLQSADLVVHPVKLGAKIAILDQDIPQANYRFLSPLLQVLALDRSHFRAARAEEFHLRPDCQQIAHQAGGVCVAA